MHGQRQCCSVTLWCRHVVVGYRAAATPSPSRALHQSQRNHQQALVYERSSYTPAAHRSLLQWCSHWCAVPPPVDNEEQHHQPCIEKKRIAASAFRFAVGVARSGSTVKLISLAANCTQIHAAYAIHSSLCIA
eukprot:6436-Heterococcus_DN1.PRE.2